MHNSIYYVSKELLNKEAATCNSSIFSFPLSISLFFFLLFSKKILHIFTFLMKNLPTEILINIFKRLNHTDKCSCQLVCKSWYGPASECFNKDVSLYGYRGIRKFYNSLCSTREQSMSGALIRKMRFIKRTQTGPPLVEQEHLDLLAACPNLQKIEYVDVNPVVYLNQMAQNDIRMDHLQDIYIPPAYRWSVQQDYLTVARNNCESMTHLYIHNSGGGFGRGRGIIPSPFAENLPSFVEEFPLLETLTISGSSNVSITSILDVCPNLMKLSFQGGNRNNYQLITESQQANLTTLPAYTALENLSIPAEYLNIPTAKFILYHLTRLRKLKIASHGYVTLEELMDGFNVFQAQLTARPSISTLVLKNFYTVSPDFIHLVSTCFPYLKELQFIGCSFNGLWDDYQNLTFDLALMDLYMLSIDIDKIVLRSRAVKQLSIQVTLVGANNEKIYYERKGKLRSHHDFVRKTTKSYIKNAGKRLRASNTAVLKIKINSLNKLELYAKNSDTQTLSIKQ
jgi:hypothetical protein